MAKERKSHVLTKKEATHLLLAVDGYFPGENDHVNKRHRTEVVAEAMEREGKFDLAGDMMLVHHSMQALEKGNYSKSDIECFDQCVLDESLCNNARGTKFEKDAAIVANVVNKIQDILKDRHIDWEKSSEVITKVKREKYPDTLTMIEKLTDFSRGQSKGGVA